MKKLLLIIVVLVGMAGCEYFEDDLDYEYSVKYEVLNYSSGTYNIEYTDESGSHVDLLSDNFEYLFPTENSLPFIYLEVNNYSDTMLIIIVTLDGTGYHTPVEIIKSVSKNETEIIEYY